MEKRYQVFVSSTFMDLKEERRSIIENLLNAKYIPAGMEMFSASNDEQFKYIKKIIDNCDYYILVVGACYGTINPSTGISFTEQEYEYAISKGIPVLVFLHNNPDGLPPEKREEDKIELLKAFRKKVSENRLCKMWNNISNLTASVLISLNEETSENPQPGWIRGSEYDPTELLVQINELRLEKEKIEKENVELKKIIKDNTSKIENLASGKDKYLVKGKRMLGSGGSLCYKDYEAELTWDEIFSAVAPFLFSANSYSTYKNNLRLGINTAYSKHFEFINDDCAQTIKIQLNALGLIRVASNKATTGGIMEFIDLTQKGGDYLLYIKSIRKS